MSTKIKKFTDGVLIGLGIAFVLGLVGVVSAAWEDLTNATDGGILTSTEWNKILDNQRYLKEKVDKQLTYMFIDIVADQTVTTDGTIVSFDNPVLERGSGTFDSGTYTFTAGETGIYQITTDLVFRGTGTSTFDDTGSMHISVNGVSVDGVIIDPNAYVINQHELVQSFTTIKPLNAGDQVNVVISGIEVGVQVQNSSGLSIIQLP